MLPLALLVLVGLFRAGRERFLDDFSLWSFLAIAVAALFMSQPNGVTALLAFSVPLIAAAWFSQLRARIRARAGFKSIALLVLWGVASAAAFLVVWQALLLDFDSWKPSRTLDQAVGDVATGTLLGGGETMVASVAALVGILTIIWRRRGGWIIACALIAAALYVVAAFMYQGRFRHFTIGSWYQDPYRLAALVPLFMIVLGSVGADGLVSGRMGIASAHRCEALHRPAARPPCLQGIREPVRHRSSRNFGARSFRPGGQRPWPRPGRHLHQDQKLLFLRPGLGGIQ